jgi:hypothetical protein
MARFTYKQKYYAALVVAIFGGLAIASGAAQLQGSFGVRQLVQQGATTLVVGLVVFIPSAPLAVYYAARKNTPYNPAELEITALLEKNKEKIDKEH